MPHAYLGQFVWKTDADDRGGRWQAPSSGSTGCLDLRNRSQRGQFGGVPQGHAFFIYDTPQVDPALLIDLGTDITATLTGRQQNDIKDFLNIQNGPQLATNADDLIQQLFTDPSLYDATGQSGWKPIRPSVRRGRQCIVLGSFGRIFDAQFRRGVTSDLLPSAEVFRADYRREVGNRSDLILRKWTGATLLKLYGEMTDVAADDLMPPEHRAKGYERPTTTISDDFNRADEALDAGPWVEDASDFEVLSNEVNKLDPGGHGRARHTTSLSTDDQDVQWDVTSTGNSHWCGILARLNTDPDFYSASILEFPIANSVILHEYTAGTPTVLDTTVVTVSLPDPIRITVDGSDITSFWNGILVKALTDTTHTGILDVGIKLRRTGDRGDNFIAFDMPRVHAVDYPFDHLTAHRRIAIVPY